MRSSSTRSTSSTSDILESFGHCVENTTAASIILGACHGSESESERGCTLQAINLRANLNKCGDVFESVHGKLKRLDKLEQEMTEKDSVKPKR